MDNILTPLAQKLYNTYLRYIALASVYMPPTDFCWVWMAAFS